MYFDLNILQTINICNIQQLIVLYCHTFFTQLSLTEPVEPLDYEEFLTQHMNILNRDPLKHILDFPPTDVAVKIIPRKIRTIEHVVPKENM